MEAFTTTRSDYSSATVDIAEYMQRGNKRRIIEAFRGVGKSWMAVAYTLWLLRNDPQKKIMVVSARRPGRMTLHSSV